MMPHQLPTLKYINQFFILFYHRIYFKLQLLNYQCIYYYKKKNQIKLDSSFNYDLS